MLLFSEGTNRFIFSSLVIPLPRGPKTSKQASQTHLHVASLDFSNDQTCILSRSTHLDSPPHMSTPSLAASQFYEARLGRELNQSSYWKKNDVCTSSKCLNYLLLSPVPGHACGNQKTARHSPALMGLCSEMITWYVKVLQLLLGGGEERIWK